MTKPLALVVDDEPDICELLAITLERMNIQTHTCFDVATAKEHLSKHEFQLCLTDMRLPDGDGLELVEWMQAQKLTTPVAVITAHGNVETAVRALKSGAFDFISKPLDLNTLRKLITSALRMPQSELTEGKAQLLGDSPKMLELRQLIGKVARSQAPVHITGESGTGKELVARMIHEQGPRAEGRFVPVNCGAIPGELMESEFFGHRKGSFTGAVSDKQGLFQTAEGGTLFLDEVADLPLPMQVKLLRVIQEKKLRPVGQAEEISVDVRILSATHQDLGAQVAAGLFREDLYYRVNVIALKVPPLRERIPDLMPLVDRILVRLADNFSTGIPEITSEAVAKLKTYHFPGNVRELENILERAVALSGNEVIHADDIHLQTGSDQSSAVASGEPAGRQQGEQLGDQLESVERDAIIQALEQQKYNKTAAARSLGLTLRALRYRMQKLGID